MYATIRGTKIYYEIHGEGPPLLLVPGGPGSNHVNFKQEHMPLLLSHQLIMYDPRGTGKSDRCPVESYDIDNYIEDLEALRQTLGFDKINVLGRSNGGIVAQGYALKYPNSIDHLILVATTPSFRFAKKAQENLISQGTAEQIAAGEKIFLGDFRNQKEVDDAIHVLNSLYSDRGELDKSPKDDPEEKPQIAYEPLVHGFKTYLKTFDFEPMLHKVKQKTLIIAGDHDWMCDVSFSKRMHKVIPDSKLVILDAGHLVDRDQPEHYITAIKEFLGKGSG